jgi:hypothetical protein
VAEGRRFSLKGRAARVRWLFQKLTRSILDFFCPITRLQLLGLRHRRYTAHQLGTLPTCTASNRYPPAAGDAVHVSYDAGAAGLLVATGAEPRSQAADTALLSSVPPQWPGEGVLARGSRCEPGRLQNIRTASAPVESLASGAERLKTPHPSALEPPHPLRCFVRPVSHSAQVLPAAAHALTATRGGSGGGEF